MTLGAFTGYFRNRESTKNTTFPYGEYSRHYILGIIYSRTDMYEAEKKLLSIGIDLDNGKRKALGIYISSPSDEHFTDFMEELGSVERDAVEVRSVVDACLIDEKVQFSLDDLPKITSVVRDFDFFLQEKWQIAIDRPGSGNTKNIGSTTDITKLKEGTGLFTTFKGGKDIYDDFWMHYLTKDMAAAAGFDKPPYKNIETYFKYKKLKPRLLK